MEICKSLQALAVFRASIRSRGQSLALIPTMGALHEGHLSLIKAAQADGHATLTTIFVNPTQFAAHEDLDTYPNTLEADLAALEGLEVDGLFLPGQELMYPKGEATRVKVGGPAEGWESADRSHFFEGVATVVTKLLSAAQADAAYFGEKDYQQLQVIRRLAADLLIPTEIIGCPTIREASGLALSSRNMYLSEEQRSQAAAIFNTLTKARNALLAQAPIFETLEQAKQSLLDKGGEAVSYLAYVEAETLRALKTHAPEGSGRLLFAGTFAGVRLIDNIAV